MKDIQNYPDQRGIEIQQVGVKRFPPAGPHRYPVRFFPAGAGRITASASLREFKGTHEPVYRNHGGMDQKPISGREIKGRAQGDLQPPGGFFREIALVSGTSCRSRRRSTRSFRRLITPANSMGASPIPRQASAMTTRWAWRSPSFPSVPAAKRYPPTAPITSGP